MMTYYVPDAIATSKTVFVQVTEVTRVAGDVYKTSLGNIFEFHPSRIYETYEEAKEAGMRDLFLTSLKIKEYLKK